MEHCGTCTPVNTAMPLDMAVCKVKRSFFTLLGYLWGWGYPLYHGHLDHEDSPTSCGSPIAVLGSKRSGVSDPCVCHVQRVHWRALSYPTRSAISFCDMTFLQKGAPAVQSFLLLIKITSRSYREWTFLRVADLSSILWSPHATPSASVWRAVSINVLHWWHSG